VAISRTAVQVDNFRLLVDERLGATPPVADVAGEVESLERLLLGAAYEAGLCERKSRPPVAVRVHGWHQRDLERARRRLLVLDSLGDSPAVALQRQQLRACVAQLQQRRVDELGDRRRVQRQRRASARLSEAVRIQQLWAGNEAGLLARQL